jgi:hypothetical protein
MTQDGNRLTAPIFPYLVAASIILLAAFWLWWVGRVPICTCGYVKLWHGETFRKPILSRETQSSSSAAQRRGSWVQAWQEH